MGRLLFLNESAIRSARLVGSFFFSSIVRDTSRLRSATTLLVTARTVAGYHSDGPAQVAAGG